MTDPNDPVAALEAVYHEAGLAAFEKGASTSRTRAVAQRLSAHAKDQLATQRRAEMAQLAPVPAAPRPQRPGLAAMTRAALIRMLEDLRAAHPAVLGFAHHDLDALSDNDLRTMIEDAELALDHGE